VILFDRLISNLQQPADYRRKAMLLRCDYIKQLDS